MSTTPKVSLDDVVDELNDIVASLQDSGTTDWHEWQRQLKTALCSFGQTQGYATCSPDADIGQLDSTLHQTRQSHDAAWLKFHEGGERKQLCNIELALECADAEDPDTAAGLYTLLDGTATFKVLFFWCQNKDDMRRMFQVLEDDIKAFEGGAHGTYVLLGCDATWDTLTSVVAPKSA